MRRDRSYQQMAGHGRTDREGRERALPKLRDIRAIRDASILRLWRGWDDERRGAKQAAPPQGGARRRRGPS